MTIDDFKASVTESTPPEGLSEPLRALWTEAKGDWHAAHAIVQDDGGTDAAWVHAYLHRKEPDPSNARYWYGRAGQPVFEGSFDAEWTAIAEALLKA